MAEVKLLPVAPAEEGMRLDRWLRRRWPHLTQIQILKLARSGQLRQDGARVKADTRLSAGATIRVPPLPEGRAEAPRAEINPRDVAFVRSLVLYEDDEVLALNKPAGLAVQGGTKTHNHIDRLLGAWGEGASRPRLTHRLDRDTSGVLLLAKTPDAAAFLAGGFARRRAEKTYWAVVVGHPDPARPAEVKPRLAPDVVLHRERYGSALDRAAIAAYDAELASFQRGQNLPEQGWTPVVLKRVGSAAALNGRDRIAAALRKLGFGLK